MSRERVQGFLNVPSYLTVYCYLYQLIPILQYLTKQFPKLHASPKITSIGLYACQARCLSGDKGNKIFHTVQVHFFPLETITVVKIK